MPDALAQEMAEGFSYIYVRLHWQWCLSEVPQVTDIKHLIVYVELPIIAELLTSLSAISNLYVSAEMSRRQIWKVVDIQISSLTNFSQ